MSPIFRLSLAVILVSSACADLAWADCEAYRHLEDKAWVDGDCMETPLGERWWPHPIWGEDDEAGSTNWHTKPEVVQRALAMIKTGNVLKYRPHLQRGHAALRLPPVHPAYHRRADRGRRGGEPRHLVR